MHYHKIVDETLCYLCASSHAVSVALPRVALALAVAQLRRPVALSFAILLR